METVNVYWNIRCKEIRLQFYSRGIHLNHAHNKLAGVSSGMPGSAPFWNPKQEKIMLLHSHCCNNHHTEVDDGGYEAPVECSLANIEDGGDPVLDSLAQQCHLVWARICNVR